MKRIRQAIILIIVLLNVTPVKAQNNTVIRGKVIDKADKTTIIGANIVETDNDGRVVNGTVTNVDGNFTLQLKNSSNSVKVSVIGYNTQEIKIDPNKAITIELESSDVAISEVTITAQSKTYGGLTNIDDRDKASSSVKVDLMEMKNEGILSAADALQGKISGLDIISASGDPGSGSQLVIRGLSSMGNSKPLIVIDGIPQFRISSSFDLSSADSEDISNLINIALQDIKSIEVLKDAASTSVYGSQGADGVLLIETNTGKMGKVQFDAQYKNSINIQPPAIPMLNGDEYIMLQLEAWHNRRGEFELPNGIAYDKDYIDFYNYSANTDWIGELTKNGITNDTYFSVSGGAEKTRYFTSFSYVDEGGTTIGTRAKRFSTRIKLDYFLSRKLLFQVKFNYINNFTNGNPTLGGKNVREMAYIKAPNMSIWEYDPYGNLTGEYFTPINNYQGSGISYYNPVALANLGKNDNKFTQIENTFLLQYRLNDWLTLRETISFQFQGTKMNSIIPYNAIGSDWLNSYVNRAEERNNLDQALRTETQLAFGSPFKNKDHQISGAFTWITSNSANESMRIRSTNNSSTYFQDPSVTAQVNYMATSTGERAMLSGLSNLNYKYADRYLFQAILRADAHSSFGANNRWGLFKGLSLWSRFSGTSGRQPSDVYARFATYETASVGSYIDNPSVVASNIQLNNLRWESITSYNVGVEFSLFKDRFYFEGDIYEKVTSDILFRNYDIPFSSGFQSLNYLNGGELTNHGWEIMADARIIRTKDWRLSVNFNSSQNINSFNKLPENFNTERSTSIGNGQYPLRVIEGEPIGSFFGFRYLGVWANDEDVVSRDSQGNIIYLSDGSPLPFSYMDSYVFKGGDPIYEDINHDGKIDLNDVVYIGDSNPDFIGGFGSTLKYKNFDFSVNFHYRIGYDIINMVALQTEGMNNRNNQSKAVLYRWRFQGDDEEGMLPLAYMNHPASNLGSDRYVEKGDFLRLNNIKFGYQVDKDFCNRLGIRNAALTVSARKLFTFTNYSGQDPEVGQDASDPFWIGVDNAKTPPPKIITFSLAVGF